MKVGYNSTACCDIEVYRYVLIKYGTFTSYKTYSMMISVN
ncbi:hypothetical protein ACVWY7_004199 [Bacillus sp. TE9106W]